jgi:hypothetical protein
MSAFIPITARLENLVTGFLLGSWLTREDHNTETLQTPTQFIFPALAKTLVYDARRENVPAGLPKQGFWGIMLVLHGSKCPMEAFRPNRNVRPKGIRKSRQLLLRTMPQLRANHKVYR